MDLTKYPMDKQTCTLQLESCEKLNPCYFYTVRKNILDLFEGLSDIIIKEPGIFKEAKGQYVTSPCRITTVFVYKDKCMRHR